MTCIWPSTWSSFIHGNIFCDGFCQISILQVWHSFLGTRSQQMTTYASFYFIFECPLVQFNIGVNLPFVQGNKFQSLFMHLCMPSYYDTSTYFLLKFGTSIYDTYNLNMIIPLIVLLLELTPHQTAH
jgi:hypothetical protein